MSPEVFALLVGAAWGIAWLSDRVTARGADRED